LSVRVAGVDDLAAILAVERTSEGPHWSEEQYREALAWGDGAVRRRVFVWDEVVGFAVGMVLEVGEVCEGELEHVVVKAGARRMGVGRALCDAVIGWVREMGCERVRLEVRASNPAVRLYEGLGFREVGRRRAYYKGPVEDAVLMEL
jgi:ribosomal-protein-alanine N-acetyltransferase